MVATIPAVCDYILTDLQTHVSDLTDATAHLYVPWSLETLTATRGQRHISVHINAEDVTEFSTNGRTLLQHYEVLVWEDASAEGAKRQDDDAKDLAWLELFEAVRARFFVIANWTLGSTATIQSSRYVQASFAGTANVRVMSLIVEVSVQDSFT